MFCTDTLAVFLTHLYLIVSHSDQQKLAASSCHLEIHTYRICSAIRPSFFPSKHSQKSRSVLQDGSRSLGLLRKAKACIIAKFHGTDLGIYSHFREGKALSYSH